MPTDTVLARLEALGYALPPVPAAAGSYVQSVRSGNLLFLAGGISIAGDDKVLGHLGKDVSIEQGQHAARMCILGRLAVIADQLGSLAAVKRIVKLEGLVASTAEFTDHPKVINGASELLLEIFGPEVGPHARVAYGVAALPLGVAVEIALTVEV